MTIRHLRIFLAVSRTGTTVAAAAELHISQPSVSAAVAEMERAYGVALFDRFARRMSLTDAGERLRGYAAHIVDLFDQMERGVGGFEAEGRLRVASSITIGTELLPGLLVRLNRRYPKLDTEVRVGNSELVERLIMSNEADIGFLEGPPRHDAVLYEPFYRDVMVFLCAPSHRFAGRVDVEPGELEGERMLYREEGSAGRALVEGLMEANGVRVKPAWISISTEAILSAAAAGLGVAVLPRLLVRQAVGRGEASPFEVRGMRLERRFAVARRRNKMTTKGMEALWELCGDLARQGGPD